MKERAVRGFLAGIVFLSASAICRSQTASPVPTPEAGSGSAASSATPTSASAIAGGRLHGFVKSGAVPLPGVTITAQNTLTGKRYSTTSDATGAWALAIPQNGRYVIR